jgi:hypothetical protein
VGQGGEVLRRETGLTSVPWFGQRMVCTAYGMIGADGRPNWKEQPTQPSLTGKQWR